MSSFICSAKHFNSIENKLHLLAASSSFYVPYSLKEITPKFYDRKKYLIEDIETEISEIIDTLRELNVLCVSLQYKHNFEGTLDNEIKEELTLVKTKTDIKGLTRHGLFNALRCVDYQIESEHLNDLRSLTQNEENALAFVKGLYISIALDLVRELPDDKSNKWSID